MSSDDKPAGMSQPGADASPANDAASVNEVVSATDPASVNDVSSMSDAASLDASPEAEAPLAADSTQEPPAVNADATSPAQLPGGLLAARRQALGLSIEDVSQRVRLAPRQIIALEADDFESLPGAATLRGFIRSYAKLLGLDPAPLVAMLPREPNPALDAVGARRPLPASGFRPRRYGPSTQHRRGAWRMAGLAAVVLVFVGTLAFVAYRNDWLPSAATQPEQGAAASDGSDMAVGNASGAPEPLSVKPEMPAQSAPEPASAATVAPATSAPATPTPATSAAAAAALKLNARQDAWVEVIAIRGEKKLLSKLMRAGSTELVQVSEPVTLVVGNVSGVDAVFRGQSLNLGGAARDNVARLRVE